MSQRLIDLWQSLGIFALACGLLTLAIIVARILALIKNHRHD